jgi:hypothetical protein
VLAPRPAHEQRHAHMISKGVFIRSKMNSYSCRWSAKEVATNDKIEPLGYYYAFKRWDLRMDNMG